MCARRCDCAMCACNVHGAVTVMHAHCIGEVTLMHALHWIEERGPPPAKGSITFGSFKVICEH